MSTQFFGHIIDGVEVESLSGERFDVWNPYTQEVFAQAAEGGAEDAERAIASARKAFDEGPWPRMTGPERAAAIHKLADLMEERADDLATLDSTNMGKPFAQAKHDVGRSVANFRFFADHQRDHTGEVYPMPSGHHTYSEFGPVGVVAAISPWNFPLMMATWKIAPAIAWGNTCIIKPSEDTPASVTLLGRLAVEAGFPPGVLNVLNGHGAPAGSTLTADDRVDRVTFTGSSTTGKTVMASASTHLAPVSLELGGKGANIVFDDADIDNAVHWAVEAIFRNSGQICLAGSRLFVQSGIYDEFMKRFVEAAEALTIGDPFDPDVKYSSLASKKHFDKVSGYLEGIEEQGGRMLTGGVDEEGRWLVRPTVLVDLPLDSRQYCEEIFGPVLSIIPFDSEEDGINIANDTPYGLTDYVQTQDKARAARVTRALRAGMVEVNGQSRGASAPFGGMKQSGNGREGGPWGIEDFVEVKSVSGYDPAA
jgi:aminomuconate-semialdehyde/2-hydroxymuconate-6-semialdehyde dehydrogenase